ncbi:hypothetical protein [Allorhizocola rhizosphaerae]|uniref:hypothetical protein n=1 Tax=Allorhizocola rhizosphaerae TaxID=1872709 RepID=UPI0013C2E114|nr:hypothetical protein [Allorhizocola rhizosphaerae]
MGAQIDEQLPITEPIGEPVRHMHSQGGLTHAGHAIDGMDRDHPTSLGGIGDLGGDLLEFLVPAHEQSLIGRQRAPHRPNH